MPTWKTLNPAQKHLLRLGPGNAARIQNKLRALAAAAESLAKKNSRHYFN